MIMPSMESLLDGTPEAMYWVGFIIADGHLSKLGRLCLCLSDKDRDHLEKFARFIGFKGTYHHYDRGHGQTELKVMNRKVAAELRTLYGFSNRKTCEPCGVSHLPRNDNLFSLIVGFVDGDGCIVKQSRGRRDCRISIKSHANWVDNLKFFARILSEYEWDEISIPEPNIKNCGYAVLTIANNVILGKMKEKAIALGLPILTRKWDKIDAHFKGKRQVAVENLRDVKILLQQGMRNKDIAKELCLSESGISMILKRNGLKRNGLND